MGPIEAVYQGGVFKPLDTVPLPENQRVRLAILPDTIGDAQRWLDDVRRHQQQTIANRGCFPNSATEIAADRARDE
jgi:predicted DNA-binding antitoxin AbrB/MazE fold protein